MSKRDQSSGHIIRALSFKEPSSHGPLVPLRPSSSRCVNSRSLPSQSPLRGRSAPLPCIDYAMLFLLDQPSGSSAHMVPVAASGASGLASFLRILCGLLGPARWTASLVWCQTFFPGPRMHVVLARVPGLLRRVLPEPVPRVSSGRHPSGFGVSLNRPCPAPLRPGCGGVAASGARLAGPSLAVPAAMS